MVHRYRSAGLYSPQFKADCETLSIDLQTPEYERAPPIAGG